MWHHQTKGRRRGRSSAHNHTYNHHDHVHFDHYDHNRLYNHFDHGYHGHHSHHGYHTHSQEEEEIGRHRLFERRQLAGLRVGLRGGLRLQSVPGAGGGLQHLEPGSLPRPVPLQEVPSICKVSQSLFISVPFAIRKKCHHLKNWRKTCRK